MTIPAVVGYYEPWWVQVIKALVIFVVALSLVPAVLLAERKLLGRLQSRYGPNRVGPFGALQPLADILKLLTKEQFRPTTSVGLLFAIAPVISILTAVAAFALIPFGDTQRIFGTRVGLYGVDVSIGPLYLLAFGAIALRRHARRLVLGLQVLVSRGDARRRPADLLRGLAGARPARRAV